MQSILHEALPSLDSMYPFINYLKILSQLKSLSNLLRISSVEIYLYMTLRHCHFIRTSSLRTLINLNTRTIFIKKSFFIIPIPTAPTTPPMAVPQPGLTIVPADAPAANPPDAAFNAAVALDSPPVSHVCFARHTRPLRKLGSNDTLFILL